MRIKKENLSNWPNHHFQNYWIWSALKKRMRIREGCWEFYRNAKFGRTTYTRKEPFTSSLNHNNGKMGGTILFGFSECLFKFNFHNFNSSFKYVLTIDDFVFLATEKNIAHSKMTSLLRKVAYCL